ncbi:MAG TPA: ATP-binding cassette domain-containing protein, partial [Nocardioides sp.]|nr:ATP-binding cassette domain-containing protein [Nocardioides sp.]
MIELRSVGFGYDETPVLSDVDLTIDEGELVLVSGRTGVGKSTLLGVVTGLVPRFSGGTLSGDVLVDGRSVVHQPPRERAHLVGYVGQDPAAGFVTDSVEEELAYGMEQLGLPADTMRRRVEETLDLLGIAGLRSRDLRTLSGGEQQRVAIGSVLTMHPRLLVLDEPTSALDPTAAEEVLATLTRLVHDLGVSVLMAEHRLERVIPFADRMVLLTGDGGLCSGAPADLLATSPVVPPIVELARRLGWSPLPMTVREARRLARDSEVGAPPVTPAQPARDLVLEAEGLTVLVGATVAVREVGLGLRAGSVTALMGRNGSGKSTLLWTLQGTRSRRAGTLRVAGVDPAAESGARRRELVGLVPQTAADLLYLESVAEECAAADAGRRAGACRELLDRLVPGVPDDAHPRDLSEGQRLALVLALVLVTSPPVLLLDEPTRGLDYPAKAELAAILRALADEGHAVLVATHDVEFAA